MAAADQGGPGQDHYRLLGVARDASREEIARAWRRRARAEHPDRRPGQAGDEAAGRFRALAEAYRVLSDPGLRAAYDRALGRGQAAPRMPPGGPGAGAAGRAGRRDGTASGAGAAAAGRPVRVDGPHPVPAGGPGEDEIRLAVLAGLALRCLARDRDWPWRDRDWPW